MGHIKLIPWRDPAIFPSEHQKSYVPVNCIFANHGTNKRIGVNEKGIVALLQARPETTNFLWSN